MQHHRKTDTLRSVVQTIRHPSRSMVGLGPQAAHLQSRPETGQAFRRGANSSRALKYAGSRAHRMISILAVLLATVTTSTAVAEQEDGLYGAPVPSDAVFIRRFGGLDGPQTIFERTFPEGALPDGVYVAISASALEGAEPGAHYSVLQTTGEDFELISEPARNDPTKVHLFLLNGGEAPARLSVASGGPMVIDDTISGEIDSRAVNPVSVSLRVEAGALVQDFEVVLRRGQNITFLVADGEIRLIENTFGPVIELE